MMNTFQPNQYQKISDHMLNNYMSVVHLLDKIGPWNDRLESVYHIVKAPTFSYVKSPTATFMSAALANSSYWLDTELFNEDVIQKRLDDRTLQGEQKAHALLLEIGSVLIDKGFPLNQEMERVFCSETSPLYPYTKTFLTQCQKRNAWAKKTVLSKKTRPIHIQKENVR